MSCRVTFDVLRVWAAGEAVELSVAELAQACRLSETQTRRSLRRLAGARLLRWSTYGPGRGRRGTVEVLWGHPEKYVRKGVRSFPQRKPPPLARDNARATYPLEVCSLTDGKRPEAEPPATGRAFRWACAAVRREVACWPLPWPRRARVIAGVAWALSEALARGEVCPGAELAQVVRGVVARLRRAEGISGNARRAHAFARWAVARAASEARQAARGGERGPEASKGGPSEGFTGRGAPPSVVLSLGARGAAFCGSEAPQAGPEAERPATVAEVAAALARWRGEYMGCVYPGRGGARSSPCSWDVLPSPQGMRCRIWKSSFGNVKFAPHRGSVESFMGTEKPPRRQIEFFAPPPQDRGCS